MTERSEDLRILEEALAERDRLLQQIPGDSEGIVTGQLTQAQQQQVGRAVEEWIRELRQEMSEGRSDSTGGHRALEQQAKRVRV